MADEQRLAGAPLVAQDAIFPILQTIGMGVLLIVLCALPLAALCLLAYTLFRYLFR
jgi:hypothetical protein